MSTVGSEEYTVRYLLSLPLDHSDSMLSMGKIEHPWDYTIEALTDYGPKTEPVDVVETFHWLDGLRIHRQVTRVNAEDRSAREPEGRMYRAFTATDREDRRRVLVVWRDMTDLNPATDRAFLEGIAADMGEFDQQLVNGDCASPLFVSLTPLFKRLMTEPLS